MKCIYPDRRHCPICSRRGRRIRIDGVRVPLTPRPEVVPCWGCGTSITQERIGAPREFCATCLAGNTQRGRSGTERRREHR